MILNEVNLVYPYFTYKWTFNFFYQLALHSLCGKVLKNLITFLNYPRFIPCLDRRLFL